MIKTEHTLAPSEKWPTQEISVRFGPFFYRVIVLTLQDAIFVPGQRSKVT